MAAIMASGEVVVEGEVLGRLRGFRFDLDEAVSPDHAHASLAAVRRVLASEVPQRVLRFEQDNDGSFLMERTGVLTWRGAAVGSIARGDSVLTPAVEVMASDYLDGPARERLRLRLGAWLNRHLRAQLKPLFVLSAAELTGSARGIAYQTIEALGLIPRHDVARQIADLSKADRKALSDLGVRIGRESIFMPALLNPRTAWLRAVLWATFAGVAIGELMAAADTAGESRQGTGSEEKPDQPLVETKPADGQTAQSEAAGAGAGGKDRDALKESGFGLSDDGLLPRSDRRSGRFFQAIGFRRFANRAGDAVLIRADALERVSNQAHRLAKDGPFAISDELTSRGGCSDGALEILLPAIRFQRSRGDNDETLFIRRSRRNEAAGRAPADSRSGEGEATDKAPAKQRQAKSDDPKAEGRQGRPHRKHRSKSARKAQAEKPGGEEQEHAKSKDKSKGRSKTKWRGDPDSPFAVLRNISFGK